MPELFADIPAIGPVEAEQLRRDKLSHAEHERHILIAADLDKGLSYRSIAAKYDVGLSQVARVAAKLETHKGAVRKYMTARALELADDWADASREAAKKGDHRPAKDWLLHAQEIDPIADTGAGITIIIGDGRGQAGPVPSFPSSQVIDTQVLRLPEP